MDEYTKPILEWGRQYESERRVTDTTDEFNWQFVNNFRRHLRSLMTERRRGVTGSWRTGYSVILETGEEIGVTNGHGPFRVFYMPATKFKRGMARNIYALAEAA